MVAAFTKGFLKGFVKGVIGGWLVFAAAYVVLSVAARLNSMETESDGERNR